MARNDELIRILRDTTPRDSGYAEIACMAADEIVRLSTALRRIRSLDPKNVSAYAQKIAEEAL